MTTPEICPEIELTEDDLLSVPPVPPLPQLGEAVHAPPELPPRTQLPAVPALPAPWEGDYAGYEVVDTPVSRRDRILWAIWPEQADEDTMARRLAIVDAALQEGGEDSDVVGRLYALLEEPLPAGPLAPLHIHAATPANLAGANLVTKRRVDLARVFKLAAAIMAAPVAGAALLWFYSGSIWALAVLGFGAVLTTFVVLDDRDDRRGR